MRRPVACRMKAMASVCVLAALAASSLPVDAAIDAPTQTAFLIPISRDGDLNITLCPAPEACLQDSIMMWFPGQGVLQWTLALALSASTTAGQPPPALQVEYGPGNRCGNDCVEFKAGNSTRGTPPFSFNATQQPEATQGYAIRVTAPPDAGGVPAVFPVHIQIRGDLGMLLAPPDGSLPQGGPDLKGNREFPIWLVSRSTSSVGEGISLEPSLNYDGSVIAFASLSTNFEGPTANCGDDPPQPCAQIFRKDLRTQKFTLVSANNGQAGDGSSLRPRVDWIGSNIAFTSSARNLVEIAPDSGQNTLLYVDGRLHLANINNTGRPASGESSVLDEFYGTGCAIWCGAPSISGWGNAVGFSSWSSNLASDDSNDRPDVFVREQRAAHTFVASLTPERHVANDASYEIAGGAYLSAQGTVIAFSSVASDLVANGHSQCPQPRGFPYNWRACLQVYVRDLSTGKSVLASASESGTPGTAPSEAPVLSADGTKVAFITTAPELVGFATAHPQAVLKDLETGKVQLLSSHEGEPWPADVLWVAIDAAGERVVFSSGDAIRSSDQGPPGSFTGAYVVDGDQDPVLISRAKTGGIANGRPLHVAISGDGQWAAFDSDSTNIDSSSSGFQQVYVVNLEQVLAQGTPRSMPGMPFALCLLAVFAARLSRDWFSCP